EAHDQATEGPTQNDTYSLHLPASFTMRGTLKRFSPRAAQSRLGVDFSFQFNEGGMKCLPRTPGRLARNVASKRHARVSARFRGAGRRRSAAEHSGGVGNT